jgi:hypothetical protein
MKQNELNFISSKHINLTYLSIEFKLNTIIIFNYSKQMILNINIYQSIM